jgi:hypothetical protein
MPDELALFQIGIVHKDKPQSKDIQQWTRASSVPPGEQYDEATLS